MEKSQNELVEIARANLEKARASRLARLASGEKIIRVSVGDYRKAIKKKCFDCNGHEDAYNRTKYCHITTCPLHSVRPFQSKI